MYACSCKGDFNLHESLISLLDYSPTFIGSNLNHFGLQQINLISNFIDDNLTENEKDALNQISDYDKEIENTKDKIEKLRK